MKKSVLAFFVIASLLFSCDKNTTPDDPGKDDPIEKPEDKPEDKPADPYADAAPEVKDGSTILVTNENVEKFITEVNYPERDYSETRILDTLSFGRTAPGNSDKPQEFTIRWKEGAAAGDPVARLWEDDGWSREYTTLSKEDCYLTITNLRPNATYHFEVKDGDNTLTLRHQHRHTISTNFATIFRK